MAKLHSMQGPALRRARSFLTCTLLALSLGSSTFAGTLANLSTRADVGTGDNVAIAGLTIRGSGQNNIVLRGIGPTLPFGNRLWDPYLAVYNANGSLVAQNNNWREAQEQYIASTGLAPQHDLESAIRINLNPGAYSAILSGVWGGTGIGTIEIYEVEQRTSWLANVSTRSFVGNGDSETVAGVILTGSGQKDLVFRGIGPTLPIGNALQNPYLVLYDAWGQVIHVNDNWQDWQGGYISASGVAPRHYLESAIRVVLWPGSCTAVLSGWGGGTGVGAIEVYDVTQPRLVWQDMNTYWGAVDYDNGQYGQELTRTGLIYPNDAGNTNVTFKGSGHVQGSPAAANGYFHVDILDQWGNPIPGKTATFGTINTTNVQTFSRSFPLANAPFIVRFRCSSPGADPNRSDFFYLKEYTVYSP